MLIAFRMKGDTQHPHFGELFDNTKNGFDISVVKPCDTVVSANKQHIDAIWYTSKWLSVDQFKALTNGYNGTTSYNDKGNN